MSPLVLLQGAEEQIYSFHRDPRQTNPLPTSLRMSICPRRPETGYAQEGWASSHGGTMLVSSDG